MTGPSIDILAAVPYRLDFSIIANLPGKEIFQIDYGHKKFDVGYHQVKISGR